MEFLKFSAITIVQFVIIFILVLMGAKFKYELNKKARASLGEESYRKVSITAQLIFLFSILNVVFLVFEISTLVLNTHTFLIFLLTFLVMAILSMRLLKNLLSALKPLILPHENTKMLSVMLFTAIVIFTMSLSIEFNFLMNPNTQLTSAEIISIKPARLSSPIRSVRVQIPAIEFNNNAKGIAFYRFDSRNNNQLQLGTINLNLIKGRFGLYRAIPQQEQNFLKGNFLSY